MTTKARSSGLQAGATAAGSAGAEAAPKRCRGSYRRQLATGRPGLAGIGPEARRCAAVILEVLAGVRTPTAAAAALSIRLPRYYLLEERAIQGLVSACAPRPKGRTVSTDRRLAQLERELATTRRELTRQQALARTAQRALGLTAAAPAASVPAGKAQSPVPGPKRRRRKPAARGLRAARLLSVAGPSGVDAPPGVQPVAGSPTAVGPAGGGSRPAATESTRVEARTEQGGDSDAGREKAAFD
jgi:hypothetical protein